MEKYAMIDIGTNSMRLLLAVVEGQRIVQRQKFLNTTRIGKSVDSSRRITPLGMETNLRAFMDFVAQAKVWGTQEIWAIATSALRDAENGQDFVEIVYKNTGVKIDIIDGKKEALLGYKGVLMGQKESIQSIFLIDIGGGSTELILGDQEKILEANSYNIGALRMTERYIHWDPPTEKELEELVEGITYLLEEPLKKYPNKLDQIIGIGGTATTIAALHQELHPYDMEKVHGYSMALTEIIELRDKIKVLNLEERMKLKGLEPKRADIIITGITIMIKIMELLDIGNLNVSEYDNLEGLLADKLEVI